MVTNGSAIEKPLGKNQEKITMYKQAQSVELLAERSGYTSYSLIRNYHFDKVLSGTSKRMEKADTPQKMTSIYKKIVWQWETAIKNDLCPISPDNSKAIEHKTSIVASMIEKLKMQYPEKLAEKIMVKDLDLLTTLELTEQTEKQNDALASSDVQKDPLVSSELVSNE